MAILVQCSSCKAKFNLPESAAGKKIRCKKCSGVIDVPRLEDAMPAPPRAVAPAKPAPLGGAVKINPSAAVAPLEVSGEANVQHRKPESASPAIRPPTNIVPRRKIEEASEEVDELEVVDEEPEEIAPARGPQLQRPSRGSAAQEVDIDSLQTVVEDPDSPVDIESDPDRILVKLGANPGFRFAGSKELDAALPYLLIVVFFGWMIGATLMSPNSGASHIGHVRWLMFMLGYTICVYPIVMVGMNAMSRSCRMGLPNGNWYKTFAIFCPPMATAIALSVRGGGVELYIIGLIIGFAVSFAAFIFLYRPRNTQAPTAVGVLSAYAIGAIIVTTFLGIGLNKIVLSVMLNNKTAATYKESPLGAIYSWNLPEKSLAEKFAEANAAIKPAATVSIAIDTDPEKDPINFTDPQISIVDASGAPDASMATGNGSGATTGSEVVKPAVDPTAMKPTTTPPDATSTNPPANGNAGIVPSPFVASAVINEAMGSFEDVLLPTISQGAGTNFAASSFLIIRQRDASMDTLEIWSTQPLAKRNTMHVPHPLNETGRYILSPKGNTLARVVEFPKKSIDLRSVETDKSMARIELNSTLGTPELMGFTAGNQIMVHWQNADRSKTVFETFSIDNSSSTRQIIPIEFVDRPGNIAISPDGRWFAIARKVSPNGGKTDLSGATPNPAPCIELYDMTLPRSPGKLFPVTAMDESKAASFSAISFSTDNQRFSALYEDGGNGLVVSFKVTDTKQSGQFSFVIPVKEGAPPADANASDGYKGQPLDVLRATTFLIRGNTVVESDQVHGTLGIATVVSHRQIDRDTILMVMPTADGKHKMVICKLKIDALFGKS